MKPTRSLAAFVLLFMYLSCAAPPLAIREPLADLPRLLLENSRITALSAYKDSEARLRLKLEHLVAINRSRLRAGLQPVRLDILASRVANKHCVEMAQKQYISHWNTRGEKPYHRYAAAGGTHAVMENLFRMRTTGFLSEAQIPDFMKQGHDGFMAEKPPNDGHRANILNPHHNAVGLGYHLEQQEFAYAQEFLNKYLRINRFPRRIRSGESIKISGKILLKGFYPFLLVVFYEKYPAPMSLKQLEQTVVYPDFTDTQFLTLWNEFTFEEKSGEFSIDVPFTRAKPGLYYIKILLSRKKGKIYNSEAGFSATSIVVRVE